VQALNSLRTLSAATVAQPEWSNSYIASPQAVGGHSTANWSDPVRVPQRSSSGRSGRSTSVNEQAWLLATGQVESGTPSTGSAGSDGAADAPAASSTPTATPTTASIPPAPATACVRTSVACPPHAAARLPSRIPIVPEPYAYMMSSLPPRRRGSLDRTRDSSAVSRKYEVFSATRRGRDSRSSSPNTW